MLDVCAHELRIGQLNRSQEAIAFSTAQQCSLSSCREASFFCLLKSCNLRAIQVAMHSILSIHMAFQFLSFSVAQLMSGFAIFGACASLWLFFLPQKAPSRLPCKTAQKLQKANDCLCPSRRGRRRRSARGSRNRSSTFSQTLSFWMKQRRKTSLCPMLGSPARGLQTVSVPSLMS